MTIPIRPYVRRSATSDYQKGFLDQELGNIQRGIPNGFGNYAIQPGEAGVVSQAYPVGDVRRYGAQTTASNNAPAIQAAIAAARAFCQPFYIDGDYPITETIILVSGVRYQGAPGGTGSGGDQQVRSTLRWSGPINTEVVRAVDVHHIVWDGIAIDCQGIAGSIGIRYGSDNAPSSGNARFENFTILNYGDAGIQWGDGSSTESDSTTIENFSLRSLQVNAVGLRINGDNSGQCSRVGPGFIQGGFRGIDIPFGPSLMRFEDIAFGGLSDAAFHIVQTRDLHIENCQSESGTAKFLVVTGTPDLSGTIVLIKNRFDQAVLIDRQCRIVSIGNGGLATMTLTPNLQIQIVSLNDDCGWPHSGTGNFVQRIDGINPFVIDQGSTDIGMSFNADHVQPAPFRFAFRSAGSVIWDLIFPCTGNVLGEPDGSVVLWNRTTQKPGLAIFPDGGSDLSNPPFSLADNAIKAIPHIVYGRFSLAEVATFQEVADFLVGLPGTSLVAQTGSVFSGVKDTAGKINVYVDSGVLTVQNKANTGTPMVIDSKTDRWG